MALHHVSFDAAQQSSVSRKYAWSVFAILIALMISDYVDRQVVVSMFPHLKAEWDLSDTQLGGLVSIVSVIVALGTIPLSLLADRWSRVNSISLMALVWSVSTIACAFAANYGQLLLARGFIGLGEAAYGSVGAALLATMFPSRMRSTVLGAFLAAGLFGSVLGVIAGGVIAERWGWQAGFGAVGVPGLILALIFRLVVRDYKTVALTSRTSRNGHSLSGVRGIVGELLRPRTGWLTCLAAGIQLAMVSTTYAWMPSFFNRVYGLSPDQAGLKTAIVVIAGGIGAIAWSIVPDRLATRNPRARLLLPAAAAVMTTLCMSVAFGLLQPGALQFGLIVAGAFVMTASIGPSAAAVVDVIHPGLRATAAATLSLTQNLLGLAAGPLLTGLLSDHFGLSFALTVVPLTCLAASVVFVLASRHYEADLRALDDGTSTPDTPSNLQPA